MPTCNGARHLREALESILEGDDFDLIVSDDRSDDDTLAIVRDLAGDRAASRSIPSDWGSRGTGIGAWPCRKRPSSRSSTRTTVMRPGHLAAHRAAFARDNRLGLVASAAGVIDADGRQVPRRSSAGGGWGPGPHCSRRARPSARWPSRTRCDARA